MSNRQKSKILAAVYGHIRKANKGSVSMHKSPSYGYKGNHHRFSFEVESNTSKNDQLVRRLEATVERLKERGWNISRDEHGFTTVVHDDFTGRVVISAPSNGYMSARAY